MITVQKVSKVIHHWLTISALMFLCMSLWDGVFPGFGAPGFTPVTAVANLVMCAMSMVSYIWVTQVVMIQFGLKEGE